MSIGTLSESDKAKIKELVNQGVAITRDVETLREGLRETVDAVAQELEIKKTVLNKAIRVAYKMQENRDALADGREELDEIEEILLIANRN
jgi:predicted nucleotide-binding protein (sugar kinase/HSP70/actin superfamily)